MTAVLSAGSSRRLSMACTRLPCNGIVVGSPKCVRTCIAIAGTGRPLFGIRMGMAAGRTLWSTSLNLQYRPSWELDGLAAHDSQSTLSKGYSARGSRMRIRAAATDEEAMTPPYNVLVTGSTKGIGYALAKEFLKAGDNVVICSRSEERVQATLQELSKEFGERAVGTTCDVRDAKSLEALAAFASSKLGYVDIWINNAGTNAYTYKTLVDSSDEAIMEIVETNTLGVMLCCRQALRMMKEQPRGGHVFNMDGAGADGNPTPRFAAYGATKRSLAQFTKSLQAELRMQGVKKVIVHNLSPGMVTTELLLSGGDTRQAKFFINALAEQPETVAQYLVPRVRAVPSEQSGNSTYIRFLTRFKAYSQILARLVFKARKDLYLKEE